MNDRTPPTFIPRLTVMEDYGGAPFLWLVDSPEQVGVGLNVGNGNDWDELSPISEELWRLFAPWAIEFDRTRFYASDFNADEWLLVPLPNFVEPSGLMFATGHHQHRRTHVKLAMPPDNHRH